MSGKKSLGCRYCQHRFAILDGERKHRCLLKPQYILDRFSKRVPKWCPLKTKQEAL